MATRRLRHAVVIFVDPSTGDAQWDHSEDARTYPLLTPAARDTIEMIYAGYKSAQRAHAMYEEAKAASKPRLDAKATRLHAQATHDAEITQKLLREVG